MNKVFYKFCVFIKVCYIFLYSFIFTTMNIIHFFTTVLKVKYESFLFFSLSQVLHIRIEAYGKPHSIIPNHHLKYKENC